uniref:Uncharacterized protein LOC111116556 n=1 Tax=Crassostrea virginica TaxID=6565 RepID=A0A8B8C6C7_CRAVI|nr:uncharacterized protein LOC111116556 [Crassostrea virginica]
MITSEDTSSKVKEVWGKIKAGVKATPTMVFSVVGDSDSFVPRPWPSTVFQTALIEAAKSGGETWILHRGKDHGVSKVVREAYQNYGVMEFEFKNSKITIENKERHVKLISIASGGTQETKIDPTIYNTEDEESEHFLLQFEKYVSEQEVSFFSQKMDFRMPVPIAIIVCEGDLETIAHIADALQNKLPVIIMKGSGKAADLIVDYLQSSKSLRKKASVLFGIRFDDISYTTLHEYLMTIRRNRDLVGVFDLNKDDPLKLSNVIGEAVVSCWSIANILPTTTKRKESKIETPETQSLANSLSMSGSSSLVNTLAIAGSSVAWKLLKRKVIRPEVRAINQLLEGYKDESRSYVLNPKYTSPASLPLYFYFGYQLLHESKHMKASGHILLLEALKANRCDYVRVLLDQGVEFKKESLPELYDQTVSCKECKINEEDCLHMQWILMQIEESQANILCNEYRGLRANENENNKEEIGNLHISVAESAKYLCRKILQYKEDRSPFDQMNTNGDHISDILLWAIFANRKELAEICWLRSENQLLTGLVCSAILKKLAKKANNVKEQILSTDLAEHAAQFEKRCLNIMDRMYEENTTHAIEVMDDEAVVWGIHSSPLTFAYENFMYDVVAHVCSQKNMNKQWYNNLTPDLKPFLKSAFTRPKAFITAPLTKFVFNYMMFFTMLVMYSAFVLTSIDTKYYVQDIARVFEYYVYFWGGGDFIEELISCFGCLESRGRSHRGNYSRMKRYLYDFWNVVDLLSYALLISALFVRHFYTSETFTIARRMFSLSLLVMYLRFMEVFLIHRTLGPTLIMIKEMLKDLFNFLFIAVFVILGVGIYYHANLFPDHQTIWEGDWTEWSFWKIIYYPYWQLYAELNLEFLEGKSDEICTNVTSEWESGLMERCPQKDWTVSGITGVYLLFSNLLLVNLVIAMFSYTFERVQENSEKLWRFERYTVINDYDWRIPSPINTIFLPYRFLCCPTREDCCLQKCRRIHCPDKVKREKGKKKEAIITYVKDAWEGIQTAVKSTPTMVFSVIGDSDSFVPRPWPRTVFQTALIEAAKSGGETWILYGGNEQDVSKAVLDAYVKYGNREFGTNNCFIHKNNKHRHVKLISFTDKDTEENCMETVIHCSSQNGGIGNFRIEFEKFVSEQEVSFFSQREDFKMPVPIAITVCEGDIETIAHIAGALQNKLPVIIMKGSGKAADLILDYLESSHKLRKKAGILFGIKFEDSIFDYLKGYLRIIRKNRDLIGVFDLNNDDPSKLSDIVGELVVGCWSTKISVRSDEKKIVDGTNQYAEQSCQENTLTAGHSSDNLAITRSSITWKLLGKSSSSLEGQTIKELLGRYKNEQRPDVLNPNFTSPTSLPLYFYFGYQILQETNKFHECGNILLLEALKENRCDYVRVLIDQGVKLKTKNLPELYAQTISCRKCKFEKDDCFHMQWILKQILSPEADALCHQYIHAMKKMERNAKCRDKYAKKIKNLESSVAESAKRLCCKILRYEVIIGEREANHRSESEQTSGISDILLWSIFADRKEIAEICWIRGKDHLLTGLVSSVLLQKLSKKAKNVKEQILSTDLAEHAKLFEQRCISIMDEMYKEDTTNAVKAMNDEAVVWGVLSCPLTIAYENFMYDVVAHTCSRKSMNKQWYNDLPPDTFPFLKSAFQRPKQFIRAPLTKYFVNYIIFLTMLVMYSAFVLTSVRNVNYEEGTGKIFEYYVYVWTFGDFIEELISCFGCLGPQSHFRRGHYRRLKRYLYDFWNAIDLLSYLLLISALFVRHFHHDDFTIARRMFSLSLLVMYLRFLEVFLTHRKLGPTLIMIKEMLKDLLNFMFIALFVILGVGIYYHANLFPDCQNFWGGNWTDWRIWEVLYYPYWQIYAELNLDYLKAGRNQSVCATHNNTEPDDWSVLAVAAAYLLFTHLLLVNLVIAMFSFTFERVQQDSEKLWWYERYTAINDYQWRIPSPLNLFFLPYRIYNGCRKNRCTLKSRKVTSNDVEQTDIQNMTKKGYRKELQRIIACNISNKK